jgi:hypothetical protein
MSLEKGREYLVNNNLLNTVLFFRIPQKWHKHKSVHILDEFHLMSGPFIVTDAITEKEKVSFTFEEDQLIDHKYRLCEYAGAEGSCFGHAKFIYDLFVHVQKEVDEYEDEVMEQLDENQ